MKTNFLVRRFDRAVLALLDARRRRRRAAEMAQIEAALRDLQPGPHGEAPELRATPVPPVRRRVPGGPGSSRRSARRRTTTTAAGAAALVGLYFATFLVSPGPPPPEAMALDARPSSVVGDPEIPGWEREEMLLAERQIARQTEVEAMADFVRAEDPELGRDLLRALEACEGDPGLGTADCGLAQERAMDAGLSLVRGDGEEPPRYDGSYDD